MSVQQISPLTSPVFLPTSPATADVSRGFNFFSRGFQDGSSWSIGEDNFNEPKMDFLPQDAFDVLSCLEKLETRAELPACPRPTASPSPPSTVSDRRIEGSQF